MNTNEPISNNTENPMPNSALNTHKKAAAYIRSGTKEEDSENSLKAQLHQISLHATQDGAIITNVFSDPSKPGSAKNYPGLQELLHTAAMKEIDVVYVYSMDRLARSHRKAVDIIKKLRGFGIQFKEVKPGDIDFASPNAQVF